MRRSYIGPNCAGASGGPSPPGSTACAGICCPAWRCDRGSSARPYYVVEAQGRARQQSQERFDVNRRDDPRLVPQRAEHPADEVRAQTGFHADDARRQLLERVFETQSSDFPPESNLPVDAQPDNVKNLLADVDTDDCQ